MFGLVADYGVVFRADLHLVLAELEWPAPQLIQVNRVQTPRVRNSGAIGGHCRAISRAVVQRTGRFQEGYASTRHRVHEIEIHHGKTVAHQESAFPAPSDTAAVQDLTEDRQVLLLAECDCSFGVPHASP